MSNEIYYIILLPIKEMFIPLQCEFYQIGESSPILNQQSINSGLYSVFSYTGDVVFKKAPILSTFTNQLI